MNTSTNMMDQVTNRINAIKFSDREKMAQAVIVLNNHQLLMKYATANNQSVPATRLYFEKVAAGASPPFAIVNWVAPVGPGPSVNTPYNNAPARVAVDGAGHS